MIKIGKEGRRDSREEPGKRRWIQTRTIMTKAGGGKREEREEKEERVPERGAESRRGGERVRETGEQGVGRGRKG